MAKVKAESLWYKDAIIYELHVKAFRDSNGDGVGDMQGLLERFGLSGRSWDHNHLVTAVLPLSS